MRGVTVDGIRRVIDWLDSDQAPDAVVSHHGVSTRLGDFFVSITPQPPSTSPRGTVLVFNVAEWEYVGGAPGPYTDIANGIAPEDRDELQALVEQVVPVLSAWNGISRQCITCSFNVDREPGAAVARAKANYRPFETPVTVVGIAPPRPSPPLETAPSWLRPLLPTTPPGAR